MNNESNTKMAIGKAKKLRHNTRMRMTLNVIRWGWFHVAKNSHRQEANVKIAPAVIGSMNSR
jgi:hypothetical protein